LLLLLTLVGGIVATAWQARIARAERAKAERRFNDVRSLANSFLFEFHDAIESLLGSTPARQLLVKRAQAYLDPLAREAGGDASLQNELATTYLKVGDVQGNPYGANLGDLPGALESYRKALAISEPLATPAAADITAQRNLATSEERIGDVLSMTGDVAGALERQRKALALRERLTAAAPRNDELLRELATSYAAGNYRKAQVIAEKLSAEDPSNIEARHALADSYSRLGAAYAAMAINQKDAVSARRAHWSEACSWYQRSQQLFRELSEQGVLHGNYAGKPAEIERELTKCETARATLQ